MTGYKSRRSYFWRIPEQKMVPKAVPKMVHIETRTQVSLGFFSLSEEKWCPGEALEPVGKPYSYKYLWLCIESKAVPKVVP